MKHRNPYCRRASTVALVMLTIGSGAACRSSNNTNAEGTAANLVIINAPANGEVRRVFAREDVAIAKDAPVVEIAVATEANGAANTRNENSAEDRARLAAQNAQNFIQSAQAATERAAVEVQRLTPLIASGQATQPQLDAARVEYQRAQERLQQARDAAQNAQTRFIAQEGRGANSNATTANLPPAPREQFVIVRAPSDGTVRAVGVRAGQRVIVGQALATIGADAR